MVIENAKNKETIPVQPTSLASNLEGTRTGLSRVPKCPFKSTVAIFVILERVGDEFQKKNLHCSFFTGFVVRKLLIKTLFCG
jgi:hypothetical protein